MDLRLPPPPGSDVATSEPTSVVVEPAAPAESPPWDPFASRQSQQAAAKAATNEAVHRVAGNTDPEWRAFALEVVEEVAKTHAMFSSDDIWPLLPATHNNSALGPIMRQAAANGWCVHLGEHRPSTMPEQHQKPQRLWTSLLYDGEREVAQAGDTLTLVRSAEHQSWGRRVLCTDCTDGGDCSTCNGKRQVFQTWVAVRTEGPA